MIDTQKSPQPKTVTCPTTSSQGVATKLATAQSQERIQARAYELYENRGREPGQHQQDWMRAEEEILKRG